MATRTYSSIAYTVLSAPAASITFSSISSAYSDLRLVISGVTSSASYIKIQVNTDTGTNYSYRYLAGNGAAGSSASAQSTTFVPVDGLVTSTSTTVPSMATVDFMQYKNTSVDKTILATSANDLNGSGETVVTVGLWRSTSAITSIQIFANSGNLATGFTAELIGIL
jgi:hypothetical protein